MTFRYATMHHTFKGIYLKVDNHVTDPNASAEITNILYENITMEEPEQVPIWIGPAQEADSKNACSLTWPELPLSKCPPPIPTVTWTNLTLRNIRVIGAKVSPGVIFGNSENPIRGLVFDGVVFDPASPRARPWKDQFYYCKGVDHGVATHSTTPVPPCFSTSSSARVSRVIRE